MSGVRFTMLGTLAVADDAGALVAVPGARQRALLASLLLSANVPVSAAALAEAVWDGSPPPGSATTLRSHIRRLRQALGPQAAARIKARNPGHVILVGEEELDVLRFEAACRDTSMARRAARWPQASAAAAQALELWRGTPLLDVDSQVLRDRFVPRLEQMRVQAAEDRAEAELRLGHHDRLIPELRDLATEHPLRENFHAQLMEALARAGRQAEALQAYQRARRMLVNELGIEPGPHLQRLHQQVLHGDPALVGEPAAVADPAPVAPTAAEPGSYPVTVPQQLPGTVPQFTGRSEELAQLSRHLDDAGRQAPGTVVISAIGGTAGVGKTALAIRWAHQVAGRFPDGQLYVNLRGYDPDQMVNPADALAGFLRALGVPGPDIPPDPEGRAARYRSLLTGRRVLVVLDNARSAEQVRLLLPATPACLTMVTSRDSLTGLVAREGAVRLSLDLLPEADAIGLLYTLIGERARADPAATTQLAIQCARLPLALRVAAELAIARPAVSLTALAGELADQQRGLEMLNAGGDLRTGIRAVFSWSYRHLDAKEARLFRLLGLHPGADLDLYAAAALAGTTAGAARRELDVSWSFRYLDTRAARAFRLAGLNPGADLGPHAVAALTSATPEESRGALGLLARAHLIQQPGPDRYGLHDLLRAYARELAAAHDDKDGHAALTRLFDYYLYSAAAATDTLYPAERHRRPRIPPAATPTPPVTEPAAAQAWLDAERANLVAVTVYAARHGWPAHATRLAAILFRYLAAGCHFQEAITIYTHARTAARQAGDQAAEATTLSYAAGVYWQQSQYQRAADHLQQARALSQQTGDRSREADTLANLGLTRNAQSRYQEASTLIAQAMDTYRQVGDRSGEIKSLCNLGNVEERQGHYQQAVRHLRQSLAIARKLDDRFMEHAALINLGTARMRQGDLQQAVRYLSQGLAFSRETSDRCRQADALTRIGDVCLRQGRTQEACDRIQEALALYQEIGRRAGEADALNSLGEALLAADQPGHAFTQHTTARDIASDIGDEYQRARAHDGLAHAHHALARPSEARDHWEMALALYTHLGSPEADQVRAKLADRRDLDL